MVKLEPPASASLFVRINVPLVTTVPPVNPLLPLRINVPASFNKSEPLPEMLSLMLPAIVSVVSADGAIVRLPARATLAAMAWLPPVTVISAGDEPVLASVRLPEVPGVNVYPTVLLVLFPKVNVPSVCGLSKLMVTGVAVGALTTADCPAALGTE